MESDNETKASLYHSQSLYFEDNFFLLSFSLSCGILSVFMIVVARLFSKRPKRLLVKIDNLQIAHNGLQYNACVLVDLSLSLHPVSGYIMVLWDICQYPS